MSSRGKASITSAASRRTSAGRDRSATKTRPPGCRGRIDRSLDRAPGAASRATIPVVDPGVASACRERASEPRGGARDEGGRSGAGRPAASAVMGRCLDHLSLPRDCRPSVRLPRGAHKRRSGPSAGPPTLATMDRRSASCCSPSSASGVFLAGLELMVTAVALPSILADLADPARRDRLGRAAQGQLDHQRLPAGLHPDDAAGRPAGRPVGRPSPVHGRPGRLRRRVRAGRRVPDARPADRRAARPGVGGGVLVPVGTAAAAHLFDGAARPRALGVIGALTFLGMAAGPFVGAADPGIGPSRGARSTRAGRRPIPWRAILAPAWRWVFYLNVPIGLDRPDRSPGPRRPAGRRRAGPAGSTSPGAALFGVALVSRARRPHADRDDRHRRVDRRPGRRHGRPARRRRRSPRRSAVVRGLRIDDPFLDPRLFRSVAVQLGRARLAADRLCVRDRDHRRGGLRRPGPLRRAGRAAPRPRRAGRRDRRRRARVGLPRPVRPAPARHGGRPRARASPACCAMSRWTLGRGASTTVALALWRPSASASG